MKTRSNLDVALGLARSGIPCFPCGPDKRPLVKWSQKSTCDVETIRHWWRQFPDALPALPTGSASGLMVIDLDVKNQKNGVKVYKRLGYQLSDAGALVRTASGGWHLYFEHVEGVNNSQGRLGEGIDVRAQGGYVIAAGATGPMGAYSLVEGQIDAIGLVGVKAPVSLREQLLRPKGSSSDTVQTSLAELESALSYIPSDGSRDEWIRILMALHAACGGSSDGLRLAQAWSASYPGYDPVEVDEQWRSFKSDRSDGITVATLFREARRCGWRAVTSDDFDDVEGEGDEFEPGPIAELNRRYAIVRLGGSAVIADFRESGDIDFLSTAAFKELYANRKYRRNPLGSAWLRHPKRRTFLDGVIFDPTLKSGSSFLNLYRGFAVKPDPDCAFDLIYNHIFELIAGGNQHHADYIFSWLADIVQNPAEKPGVALVLKGKKGVGKDTLAEIMKAIIGRRHTAHVESTHRLTARFNAAFATALLIHVEEAIWGGQQDSKGVVQSLITCPSLPLERKHVDTVEVDNYSRLLFTTNESWAIPATADERRYAVFDVSPARRGDRDYFCALYRQIQNGGLNGFLAFLQSWRSPEGVDLRNPPQTKGLMEQKLSGLKGVERWWYDALCEGSFPVLVNNSGFCEEGGTLAWPDAPQIVGREDIREAYNAWVRQMRYQGDPKGPAEFGEIIRALCPLIKAYRPTENGRRVWKYRFPPLGLCRDGFGIHMGGSDEDIVWDR